MKVTFRSLNYIMPGSLLRVVNLLFNADLTYFILDPIPDIYNLQSYVLYSKFVYNIFDTHRVSVPSCPTI